jgi:hypothetical protein
MGFLDPPETQRTKEYYQQQALHVRNLITQAIELGCDNETYNSLVKLQNIWLERADKL